MILDEIQTGFGRTGTMFAFEQYGIVPDILTIAKGMGGGFPIGGFVASREMMHTLTHNPILGHISTFGGHPVSCAASLANIEVLLEENYISEVKRKEELFKSLLIHPSIIEIRSMGLLMAVELGNYDFNKEAIDECIEQGVITDWFLFCDSSMRIAPPLSITDEEIRKCCDVILKALDKASQ